MGASRLVGRASENKTASPTPDTMKVTQLCPWASLIGFLSCVSPGWSPLMILELAL